MNEPKLAATIQDVAARAGVSAMTVSRVLNQHPRVAAGTRQRIERAIDELGYVPNALARGLLRGRTRTIGLIVGDVSNPFWTRVVRGVEDVANKNGYTVFVCNSDEAVEKEQQYVKALLSHRVDGLLLAAASNLSRKTLDFLRDKGSPFVLIDREVPGARADVVTGDSFGGAVALTDHLIDLGHRRIAFIGGPGDVSTSADRERGYEDALRRHGITPDRALRVESSYRRDGGYHAGRALLAMDRSQRPTAAFAGNNAIAVGVIEALRDARLRVPDDLALVCFDDLELASALYPFLTVAAQPARTFGTIAAQFLLDRLAGTETQPPRRVVLSPEIIIRASSGERYRP